MGLCKYANIFGEPGTGVHSTRIFGLAAVDTILTIILAAVLNYLVEGGNWKSFGLFVVFVFSLSIIIHKLFCVQTTLTMAIFD